MKILLTLTLICGIIVVSGCTRRDDGMGQLYKGVGHVLKDK